MTPARCEYASLIREGGLVEESVWIERLQGNRWLGAGLPQVVGEKENRLFRTVREKKVLHETAVIVTGLLAGCRIDGEKMDPGQVREFGNLRVSAT